MIDGKPVILFINGFNNGCDFYRMSQPGWKIQDNNIFPSALKSDLSMDDFEVWLDKADVIVTQAAMSEKFLEFMADNKGKKKFVIDSDDNVFAVTPFNPSYNSHGIREVNFHLADGSVIEVRDGKNGFDISANMKRLSIFQEALKLCDMITTPSPVLAGYYKRWNKNVRVLKNLIDFNIWKQPNIVKDDFVRIVWQGGHSHYEDWLLVEKPLGEVMRAFKNVKLLIMGQLFKGTTLDFPQDRIEVVSWCSNETYPYKFQLLNADIGIAPLKNDLFSTCKSEIKWEEYSSLSIPSVLSNIPPYSLSVSHGTTGFLASNDAEWIEYLSLLIKNKECRENVGRQAKEVCKDRYDLEKEIVKYEQAYSSLYKKELILV